MTAVGLEVTYDDLRRAVGRQLGFTDNPSSWCESAQNLIERDVESGLRMFYFPPVLPGERAMHEWTFLKPVGSIITVADVNDYDLPDDYGGMVGELTFSDDDNAWRSVTLTGEGKIRQLRQRDPSSGVVSGYPELAAVRPKQHTGYKQHRWEILFWPNIGAQYTVSFQYSVIPGGLDSQREYPYGGAKHAETLLAACLAAMEWRDKQERGVFYATFMERLMSSITSDRANNGNVLLGYNGDASIMPTFWGRHRYTTVTYNGNSYDGSE